MMLKSLEEPHIVSACGAIHNVSVVWRACVDTERRRAQVAAAGQVLRRTRDAARVLGLSARTCRVRVQGWFGRWRHRRTGERGIPVDDHDCSSLVCSSSWSFWTIRFESAVDRSRERTTRTLLVVRGTRLLTCCTDWIMLHEIWHHTSTTKRCFDSLEDMPQKGSWSSLIGRSWLDVSRQPVV